MKPNAKITLGLIIVMAGAAITEYPFIKHMARKPALPFQTTGFTLVGWGWYVLHRGNKDKFRSRENSGEK